MRRWLLLIPTFCHGPDRNIAPMTRGSCPAGGGQMRRTSSTHTRSRCRP